MITAVVLNLLLPKPKGSAVEPVEEKAYVDTWTKISGFSMHLEGEVPLQDTP